MFLLFVKNFIDAKVHAVIKAELKKSSSQKDCYNKKQDWQRLPILCLCDDKQTCQVLDSNSFNLFYWINISFMSSTASSAVRSLLKTLNNIP